MMREILVRSWSVLAVIVLGVFAALMFVIRRAVQAIEGTTRSLATTNEQLQQEIEDRKGLERELLSVIERERQRIGQELHDSIGQQLAGITFMAEVLRGKLRHKSLAKEITFAGRISTCVSQVAQQTRNLARGLAPIDLDRDGLAPALEELAANTEQLFDVSCTLECEGTVATNDASVTINLYRIAQEAITNAIKHGRAKNIRIKLAAKNGRSELSVENDGLAFSGWQARDIRQPWGCRNGQARDRGMGLRIMRYRAETINGSLNIRKGARGGTLVTCVFPNEAEPR
jgi:signal transduction histidine kinase